MQVVYNLMVIVLRSSPCLGLLLLLVLSLCACKDAKPTQGPAQPVQRGAKVAAPRRIVSFVPSLTEVAFDLGLGPGLVGVSSFDTWPQEVARLPRLGGVVDPDLEQMLALEPDLILTTPSVKGVEALARSQKIPMVSVRTDTMGQIFQAYHELGQAAGVPERAQERVQALQSQLEALRPPPGTPRPRVLLVVGRTPGSLSGLYAAGQGSFMDDLLQRAGGQNALAPTLGQWPQINKEALLASPPDVILEFAPQGLDAAQETRQAREAWAALPQLEAVKQGRVHRLVGSHLLLPGPRVVQTVRAMRQVIHAEAPAP